MISVAVISVVMVTMVMVVVVAVVVATMVMALIMMSAVMLVMFFDKVTMIAVLVIFVHVNMRDAQIVKRMINYIIMRHCWCHGERKPSDKPDNYEFRHYNSPIDWFIEPHFFSRRVRGVSRSRGADDETRRGECRVRANIHGDSGGIHIRSERDRICIHYGRNRHDRSRHAAPGTYSSIGRLIPRVRQR